MDNTIITQLLDGLLIPTRLVQIISWYLLSLMLSANKHTQKYAEKISGKANSLFSKLLARHLGLSKSVLNRAARRRLRKLMRVRKPIIPGVPWTILIIIDSTLHERSSKHVENSQKFNHGKGWIIGHQWTNIGIVINGQYIPLPPIPFYTKEECSRRKKDYKTENDKLVSYLRRLPLRNILGNHDVSEVTVTMDSGYDCKKVQKAIDSRGWDFVAAIKKDRKISSTGKEWFQISIYFGDGRRPWKAIRVETNGGKRKRRQYATKQLDGHLNGINKKVKLVCSRKSDGKIKYFACSNPKIDVKAILGVYQCRWAIETFHNSIKSYLGLEDAGVEKFDSLHSHVHWVYCAYILLHDLVDNGDVGVKEKQLVLEAMIEASKAKKIIKKATQINGKEQVKNYCRRVIKEIEVRYGQ